MRLKSQTDYDRENAITLAICLQEELGHGRVAFRMRPSYLELHWYADGLEFQTGVPIERLRKLERGAHFKGCYLLLASVLRNDYLKQGKVIK